LISLRRTACVNPNEAALAGWQGQIGSGLNEIPPLSNALDTPNLFPA
jgi:hypothetical protein